MKLSKQNELDFRSVIDGESVQDIVFNAWEIDNIDSITLMYQTGYITIKDTEQEFGETWYYLDFPNKEVENSFNKYVLNNYAGKISSEGGVFIKKFVKFRSD